jgi:hypothetical protein
MESRTKEIAHTIIKQIQYTDRAAFMAWGSSYHCEVSESKEFQGGLSFMCNGLTHQGWVTIKLRWADDYTVIFTNKKREVVKVVERVYCDELVKVIDFIEGK